MSVMSRLKEVLRTTPYAYQARGVRFLEDRCGRGILNDDMGLGKTLQAIAFLQLHPEVMPAVVVCPSSVKYKWALEFSRHAGRKSFVMDGTVAHELPGKIWIGNYDILPAWLEFIIRGRPKTLIIDECHMIKNPKARRTKAVQDLEAQCQYLIPMSGTPIVNRPIEFFTVLQMIDRREFPSLMQYALRYCEPSIGRSGMEYKGATNLDELHQRVKPYMIRRMKADVLTELPKKTRSIIPVDIANRNEYERARTEFLQWLKEYRGDGAARRASSAVAMVRAGQLKQLVARGKLSAVCEWIDDFMDASSKKLVVFAEHKDIIDTIVKRYPGSVKIDGSVNAQRRQMVVDQFQQDPDCRLFVGNMNAAGTGIDLTAASDVAVVELPWVPATMEQAEDRINRIGQNAKSINVYLFVGMNTIDEQNMEVLERKKAVTSTVLDGFIKSLFKE